MKVLVAMSGGVDSSVAAYLLKQERHEVIGLSFELWDRRDLASSNVCCSVETIDLARTVARDLGIEHYTVDVRDAFYSHVIESFCELYSRGLTPNPCILCNKYIKFDFLLKKARDMGADRVATGHYARVQRQNPEHRTRSTDVAADLSPVPGCDRYLLKKGIDPKKDQSYVLYVMKQEELSKTLFPLGSLTKDRTREIAGEIGLASALRSESQEICFVGDEDYADFIRRSSPDSLLPGPIVDTEGKVLGEHKGIAFYTIGQRKRLMIPSLKPHYVVSIDRKKNTVIVGTRDDAMRQHFSAREMNWIAVESMPSSRRVQVKVRSTMKEVPAVITPDGPDRVLVQCDEPLWAPAPGQSAVFYDEETVIGGGVIE